MRWWRRWLNRRTAKAHLRGVSAALVPEEDALRWFEARRDLYERQVAGIADFVDPEGMVLDVGANIGFFAECLCEAVGFRGRMNLFEPIPHLADICRKRTAALGCEASVWPIALGDRSGNDDLRLATDGNIGWNTMVDKKAEPGMERLTIEVRTYDELAIPETPCFIKIDVEGAEHRVLRGMMKCLERWRPRPVILCEIGWGTEHPEWPRARRIYDRLSDLGYACAKLDGTPVRLEELGRTMDVVFKAPS